MTAECYSVQAQQSTHLPQHEPAVAGQPQLHGQQSLPQQQVNVADVSGAGVMMISVRVWMDAARSRGCGHRRWQHLASG